MTEPAYVPGTEEKDPQKVIMSLQQIAGNVEDLTASLATVVSDAAGTATPLMDGTAAVGTSAKWAHDDHRHPSDTAKLNVAGGQTLTGGFKFTSYAIPPGSFTPNTFNGNYQYYTNTGAVTITAPTSDCAVDILIVMDAGASTISFSGFTVGANTGDALDYIFGHYFIISIRRIAGISTYLIKALQ